jgi:cell division septation protein DedD
VASEEKSSGISVQTLAISAAAAVAAAVVVPMIWERGTLVATAMTPVIVALVSEGLRKPADRLTAATKTARRSATGAAVRDPEFDPLPPEERGVEVRDDDPFGLRGRPPVKHHWKLALATGAAAFAIAVVGLTMSELVFGGPATRDGGSTTFFSGSTAEETATPTVTPEATEEPEQTPAPTQTATPTPTPTATQSPAPLEATPTPTPTP